MARRKKIDHAAQLVEEVEAVLTGTYADVLLARRQAVPSWAWANLLAHGDRETMQSCDAPLATGGDPRWEEWWNARRFLVGEVLAAADRRGSLTGLQREVLVPLELAMISTPAERYPTPIRWVALTRMAVAC